MVEFLIPLDPVAQGRPRFVTPKGGEAFHRPYDPKKSKDYKKAVAIYAVKAMRGQSLLEGPLHLAVAFYRPIPKSWSKKKREQAQQRLIRPIGKPDLDNYVKAVKDALTMIVWVDDSQIVDLVARKFYTPEGVSPCVRVRVTRVIPKENEDE